jgi:hypothetical protein
MAKNKHELVPMLWRGSHGSPQPVPHYEAFRELLAGVICLRYVQNAAKKLDELDSKAKYLVLRMEAAANLKDHDTLLAEALELCNEIYVTTDALVKEVASSRSKAIGLAGRSDALRKRPEELMPIKMALPSEQNSQEQEGKNE